MTPLRSVRSPVLRGRQSDLADAMCYLNSHERPEERSSCDACDAYAEQIRACLDARHKAVVRRWEDR